MSTDIINNKYQIVQSLSNNLLKVVDLSSNKKYLCIRMPLSDYDSSFDNILQIKNSDFVSVVEKTSDDLNFYLVIENCIGDLTSYIKNKNGLNISELKQFLNHINNLCETLFSNQIFIKNLGPNNFFVMKNGQLKFCPISPISFINTLPPELINSKNNADTRANLWSIGCIIYYMLFNHYPFKNENEIKSGKYKEPTINNPHLKDLIKKLLAVNPKTRINNLENYLNHEFFKSPFSFVENENDFNDISKKIPNPDKKTEVEYLKESNDYYTYYGEVMKDTNTRHGRGVYYSKEKDFVYKGLFNNNKFEGFGIYIYSNGNRYEGEWKNNNKNGKGTFYYCNGDRFEGQFKNGVKSGSGKYFATNGEKFEGEFENGQRKKGTLIFPNGDKYEGEFKNNEMSGKGIFKYKNGDKYEGEFQNDQKNGKGKYTSASGEIYTGQYLNDKKNGDGTYIYSNGDKYEGEFKNNKVNGKGIYYYSNGAKYEGTWKNNKRNEF